MVWPRVTGSEPGEMDSEPRSNQAVGSATARRARRWAPMESLFVRGTTVSPGGYVAAIAVTVAGSYLLCYDLGGAGKVAPLWYLVPVLMAAYRFGKSGTLAVAVVSGLAAGPVMPDHFANGVVYAQNASDWLTRGAAFVFLGQVIAWLLSRLREERDVAHEELRLRRTMEANLHVQEARLAALRRSSDLTTIVTGEGVIDYQSPSSSQILGLAPSRLVGMTFRELLHPDDWAAWESTLRKGVSEPESRATTRWRMRRADGVYVPMETRVHSLVHDPSVNGIVLNGRDVSERERLEEELRHQAFHDSLTGLANRVLFHDRLEQALARLGRLNGSVGVLFLDLDDFKQVNDGQGHAVGDALLQAVGLRLRDTVRVHETVSRLGGDEFGIIVEGDDRSATEDVAERVLEAFRTPFQIGVGEMIVQTSIGLVTTSDPTDSADGLIQRADVAMYAAKSAGKGRCETLQTGVQDQIIGRHQLGTDLAWALERSQLILHYQPIVDLAEGRTLGVEALLRWRHPERGMIPPTDFIPAAEANGQIVPIGRWLMRAACAQVRALGDEFGLELSVSINVSARQLEDGGFFEDVAAALAHASLDPSRLVLELTESAFMTDARHALSVLEQLRMLGVKLSIDDFGTGYSSLAYLQRLPVDELKIDRSFVAATDDGLQESSILVRTIVDLAHSFNLRCVAEGVETSSQLRELLGAGCDLAQGYYFARPMDVAPLREFLSSALELPVGVLSSAV